METTYIIGSLILFVTTICECQVNDKTSMIFNAMDPEVMDMGQSLNITMDFICRGELYCQQLSLTFNFKVEDENLAKILGFPSSSYEPGDYESLNSSADEFSINNIFVPLEGEFLGKTVLTVALQDTRNANWSQTIHIRRVETILDRVFQGGYLRKNVYKWKKTRSDFQCFFQGKH